MTRVDRIQVTNAFQAPAATAKPAAKFSAGQFLTPTTSSAMPQMAAVPAQAAPYPSAALLKAATLFAGKPSAPLGDAAPKTRSTLAAAMFGADTSGSDLSVDEKVTAGGGSSSDSGDGGGQNHS